MTDELETLEERLREAGVGATRFIDVNDGEKKSTDHTKLPSKHINGNYGIYAGNGLVILDVDAYRDLEETPDLPSTFTVRTPHKGTHHYYQVDTTAPDILERVCGARNPTPEWGEVQAENKYVVGPGSQLDGCKKEWCDACSETDGGRYTITQDREIAEIPLAELTELIGEREKPKPEPSREFDGDTEEETVREALKHVDPDLPHDEWIKIGFAVCNALDGAPGWARIFREWSKGGSKWDKDAEREIEYISTNADPEGGVSAGTLFHYAEQGGWTPPWRKTATNGGTAAVNTENTEAGEPEIPHIIQIFVEVIENRGLDPNAVHKRKRDNETEYLSIQHILKDVDRIDRAIMTYRRNSKLHDAADTKRIIAGVVFKHLQENGRFISPPNEAEYYFYHPEKKVYPITHPHFHALLETEYDVSRSDQEGKLVIDRVEKTASRVGQENEVHRIGYYNEEQGELCIHDRDGGYYAVKNGKVKHRDNGENDVFFLPVDGDKIEYIEPEKRDLEGMEFPGEIDHADEDKAEYRRILANRASLAEGGGLSPGEQRMLLDIYIHTLPFINRIPEKPILAFVGKKNSGKTATQRAIGQFITGLNFDVRMTADQEDFWTAVSNNAYVAYDQLDQQSERSKWLNDALAAVATGTKYTKRELYTTNEEAEYRPRCWLGINSRDPDFTRDDVASRLLLFRFKPLNQKYGNRAFLEPLHDHYNELFSQYIDNLSKGVDRIDEQEKHISSSFRMADWAEIATPLGEVLDYDESEINDAIDKLKNQQAAFTLEEYPTFQALKAFLNDGRGGKNYEASDLHDELNKFSSNNAVEYPKESSRGLGNWISKHEEELNVTLGIEVVRNSHRSNKYVLPASGQQEI